MPDESRGFEPEEYHARLARLREAMQQRGAAAMLVDDAEIMAYYTGYEASLSFYRACIVPLEGTPLMVLRRLDAAPFKERAWFTDHRTFADWEDPVQAVAEGIRWLGLADAAIGLDFGSHAMTLDTFRRLQAALPGASFVDMLGIPWDQRLIKSPAEIARSRRAAAIADETVRRIVTAARPGMTEREATTLAAASFLELGGEPGQPGPITSGKGWDFLHGHMHDTPLKPGAILHLELVPRFRGYSARLMRCVTIGPPSREQQDTADTLVRLQDAQIAAMRPGTMAWDVDAILRDGVLGEGLRDAYDNITGYTLGFYSRQPIRSSDFTRIFHPRAEWRLEAGMLFHMYASARGIAFSDTVHVTPAGPERLTRIERVLFSCPA